MPDKRYADSEREHRLWEEKKVLLVAEAQSLIPQVIAAQPDLLASFQVVHGEDLAMWSFSCERWGDFLSIRQARRTYRWSDGKGEYFPDKSIFSVNLSESSRIILREGHGPDLDGDGEFRYCPVIYEGTTEWTNIVQFPDVKLPGDGRRIVGSSGGFYVNGYSTDGLGVKVKGVARPSEDDKIVFGEGGGRPWDDMMGRGGFLTYSAEEAAIWKRERPGTTLCVPYGLGESVYMMILGAIRPTS